MSLRNKTPIGLMLLLLAVVATASAQAEPPPCPECDADGKADDSWYSSVDTGVVSDEASAIQDTDGSVGENDQGRFTWFQYCLKFFDVLGNQIVLTFEAFVSEDGVDLDGGANVNGEEVDVEDTPLGEVDDLTWDAMEPIPVDLPVDHHDLPQGVDHDECLHPGKVDLELEATARCDITL